MKKMLLLASLVCAISASAAIPEDFTITPGQGATVSSLKEIKVVTEGHIETYVNRSITVNGESIGVTQKTTGTYDNNLTLTLAKEIVQSGEYTIVIPKNVFEYNCEFDYYEQEYLGTMNPEITWTITIDNPDHPIIPDVPDVTVKAEPENNATVDSLAKVTLIFDGATTATPSDNAALKGVVSSLGKDLDVAVTLLQDVNTANGLSVNISPAIKESGAYTLTIPAGMVEYNKGEANAATSAEIKLNYTVKAPLKAGDLFTAEDGRRYQVLSLDPATAALWFPSIGNEAPYENMTTCPLEATYEGKTYKVTEIGRLALSEIKTLKDFIIPEGITKVGEAAFWDSSVESVSVPASVTEIDNEAFQDCKSLKAFNIPNSVKRLGTGIFYGCAQLEELTLPEQLDSIPGDFCAGAAIKKIAIPESVTRIGEFAFSECASLAEVNIPAKCTTLERFCFAYCPELKAIEIPETVTNLGNGVFYSSGLTAAKLPDNLTVIPDGTFQCSSIAEFTVGPNVETIEKEAFYWCFSLTKITFGEKVANFGADVFKGDKALTSVECLGKVPAKGVSFEQDVYDNAILIVPEGSLDAYKAAAGWKEFKNIKSNTPEGIEAVSGNDDTDVTIFNMQGQAIFSGNAADAPELRGAYIIRRNATSRKVLK